MRLWTCGFVDVRIHEMSESTRKEPVSTSPVYQLVHTRRGRYIEHFDNGNETREDELLGVIKGRPGIALHRNKSIQRHEERACNLRMVFWILSFEDLEEGNEAADRVHCAICCRRGTRAWRLGSLFLTRRGGFCVDIDFHIIQKR